MNIALTPDQEQYVNEQVAAGRYANAEAAMTAAFRLLRQEEARQAKLAALRRELDLGAASVAAGRVREFTDEVVQDIIARGRARRAAEQAAVAAPQAS